MASVQHDRTESEPVDALDALRRELQAEPFDEIAPDWWQDLDRSSQPDCSAELPLWEWLSDQASYYRMTGTSQGAWLAECLEEKAALARALRAETAKVFASKVRQLEAMR